jgi:hypothetical protein
MESRGGDGSRVEARTGTGRIAGGEVTLAGRKHNSQLGRRWYFHFEESL